MLKKLFCSLAALTILFVVPVAGVGPSFIADTTFKGSSLSGWHVVGQADWRAQDGEIIGTTKPGGSGGWLMLDRSYQDFGLYASFRCTGGCKTGVLLRAEQTPQGMKGIYVSLTDGDVGAYRVTLDAQGQELTREKVRNVGGMVRVAPPPPPPTPPAPPSNTGRGGGRGPIPMPPGMTPVLQAPTPGLRAGEWNRIEILLDTTVVRWFVNDSGVSQGAAEYEDGRYGPVALYVGGTGEVRFRDVAYKDLAIKVMPAEKVSTHFRMQRLNEFYYSWGAAAADFNRDGTQDVASGPHIYFGPDYTSSREVFFTQTINPSRDYPWSSWVVLADDFTGDGWPDILTCDHLGGAGIVLYVNPKNESRRWDQFKVVAALTSEITLLQDVDADGRKDLVFAAEGYIRYAKPDPANPTAPWILHNVSERGPWAQLHGLGAGDVNGDKRVDIVNAWGWWEQPRAGGSAAWTYHPQAFARWGRSQPGGATMVIYDVNGDGLNDIVTSLSAHNFGIAWFEQKRGANGAISFVQHMIIDDYSTKNAGNVTFSQPHAATSADVDGDGIQDLIVGKRFWSHSDAFYDADPYGAPVLYWFKTVRNPKAPGGAEFVPDLIHNRSGVGSDVLAADLNKDGAVDVITSTDRGTFIFWGVPRGGASRPSGSR
jgi:hypothetical protein